MPLYTYRCENKECKHSIEKIVKIVNREQPYDCPKCSTEKSMKLEVFTPGDKGANLYFKGNWFATKGRY